MKIIEKIEQVENTHVLKFKLTDEYFQKIKKDVQDSLDNNIDVSSSLVGAIYNGKEVLLKTENKHLSYFGNLYMEHFATSDSTPVDFFVTESWVNDQKENDYNPLHMHDNFLSGVIYIKIPTCIGKQKDTRKRTQKDNLDGFIVFLNGWRYINIQPEEGWGFIFPSNIPHMVYPFSGEETRISIAWNLDIDSNAITQPIKINFKYLEDQV